MGPSMEPCSKPCARLVFSEGTPLITVYCSRTDRLSLSHTSKFPMIPKLCSSSSLLLLLLQREPTRRLLWFSRNFFKIAICMCRIKDQQVLICKTYNWIQLSDFALSSFGILVIIMSSCRLNLPFILAPFTSCQVVKVNLFLNFVVVLSLK